ncbi:hypothetical protein CEXT_664401 [Caerostris extrusa]|uniref:Uncharacterized protein n=1 Tax=Caerostris extrusa TaxID=172846 RepID=A0AAV4VI41_CAEEX|nr:hypothetical protein CEXT_664401 [Caerostris extrusa]
MTEATKLLILVTTRDRLESISNEFFDINFYHLQRRPPSGLRLVNNPSITAYYFILDIDLFFGTVLKKIENENSLFWLCFFTLYFYYVGSLVLSSYAGAVFKEELQRSSPLV